MISTDTARALFPTLKLLFSRLGILEYTADDGVALYRQDVALEVVGVEAAVCQSVRMKVLGKSINSAGVSGLVLDNIVRRTAAGVLPGVQCVVVLGVSIFVGWGSVSVRWTGLGVVVQSAVAIGRDRVVSDLSKNEAGTTAVVRCLLFPGPVILLLGKQKQGILE